jgi:hypothetical protein
MPFSAAQKGGDDVKFGLFFSTAHHGTYPGLLAKRLATIDVLSKGRMSLPIHVGGSSLAAGPGPSLIARGACGRDQGRTGNLPDVLARIAESR